MRSVALLHSVYEPHSGLLYGTVSAQAANNANQVIAIDPTTATVVHAWSVGNGPNHLAISDDGQFLYIGLDADHRVAQVSLPSGTVNFSVGLGSDPTTASPLIADALRALPGQPHSWAVTLCTALGAPCGEGVAIFDDATQRPNVVTAPQLQPDSLVFVGSNAATLYGTTLSVTPATTYEFSITTKGIAQTTSTQAIGGATLDSDGVSIYTSNGQIINSTTLALQSTITSIPSKSGMFVDSVNSESTLQAPRRYRRRLHQRARRSTVLTWVPTHCRAPSRLTKPLVCPTFSDGEVTDWESAARSESYSFVRA